MKDASWESKNNVELNGWQTSEISGGIDLFSGTMTL